MNIVTSRHVINAYLPFPLVLRWFCQDAPPDQMENVEMEANQIAPAADATDGQGHGVVDASDHGEGHAGDEVVVNGQEPPTCVICHEPCVVLASRRCNVVIRGTEAALKRRGVWVGMRLDGVLSAVM